MIILQCAERVAGVISRGNSPGGFPVEGWQTPLPAFYDKKNGIGVNNGLLAPTDCTTDDRNDCPESGEIPK